MQLSFQRHLRNQLHIRTGDNQQTVLMVLLLTINDFFVAPQYGINVLVIVDIFKSVAAIGAGVMLHQPRNDTSTVKCFGTIAGGHVITIL